MIRQWVRVTSGKPGRGSIGYVERAWKIRGLMLTLIRFKYDFPCDLVGKSAKTFEFLTEAECAEMEIRA
jgi:hypothetical protein